MLGVLLWTLDALAGPVTVDMLDVGQGDAILIRSGDRAVLIDAGPRDADTVDQLVALGVERLDLVVATHPHADHIGRMPDVLSRFDVDLYLDNGMAHTTKNYEKVMATLEARHVHREAARQGMTYSLGDDALFTVLFPADVLLANTRSDLNSNSVVLRLDHGDQSFLFTGDAEAPTERALLQGGLGDIDLLKVAHHGSGHSSKQPFLDRVHPETALISVGADNRYHHPYEEALERLTHCGAVVYRTDWSGNIRAVSDGQGIEVFEGTIAELDAVTILPWPEPVEAVEPVEPEPAAASMTSAQWKAAWKRGELEIDRKAYRTRLRELRREERRKRREG